MKYIRVAAICCTFEANFRLRCSAHWTLGPPFEILKSASSAITLMEQSKLSGICQAYM